MLRIFSLLNPLIGSMPILNALSFNPEFIVKLWVSLENSIFGANNPSISQIKPSISTNSQNKQNKGLKDAKWANVFQKRKGKIEETGTSSGTVNADVASNNEKDEFEIWDVKMLRKEHKNISKELLYTLHLFCACYGHLLLVLDDIEFYEKQAPFTLAQQRTISNVLNTFVYNSLMQSKSNSSNSNNNNNKALMEVLVRCLHLQHERDLRHQFCPAALWLAPARKDRKDSAPVGVGNNNREVLMSVPHVYPFEERVKIFREFIKQDKISNQLGGPGPSNTVEIVIRRDKIIEDGMRQLNSIGPRLKSSIHVSFVSECGLPEAGLDYGGLSKEFLTDLAKAAFNPEFGLFTQTSTSDVNLLPNLSARVLPNGLETIEFLGRIVGKALYEGILLEISFSLVFVQKLLGRYSFLDELSSLDSELYRNLMHLKHFEGDVSELCLDFTVTEELNGRMIVHELRPGGKNVQVVNENKLQYVHAMADFKLNRQIAPFANAFYRGLSDLISPSWLSLFNANEFNQLLSGGKQDFDITDLKNNTKYSGGYSESSRTVKLFWEVIKSFSPNERCMLLKFVTSCSRAPLLGFKYLNPSFTIHKVTCELPLWATIGGQDVDRLPSASTCYNTLKLPTYKRSSTLRSKLLYSISSNTGFELS
ncbi:hypothetical protein LUZ60_005281 [Juncus effusus]|nr:hypothetical protein LUZ60_005281 [Juncus effusus]